MVDIKDLSQLLSAFFEDELSPETSREINELIHQDRRCRTFYNTFTKTIYLCRGIGEIEVPNSIRLQLFHALEIEFDAE